MEGAVTAWLSALWKTLGAGGPCHPVVQQELLKELESQLGKLFMGKLFALVLHCLSLFAFSLYYW